MAKGVKVQQSIVGTWDAQTGATVREGVGLAVVGTADLVFPK